MTTTMPFGKYKGLPLRAIPDDYLAWLLTRYVRPPLRAALEAERARRRQGTERAAEGFSLDPEARTAAQEIVKRGFRSLSNVAHPDHGGTNDAMRAALRARAALLNILGGDQ